MVTKASQAAAERARAEVEQHMASEKAGGAAS